MILLWNLNLEYLHANKGLYLNCNYGNGGKTVLAILEEKNAAMDILCYHFYWFPEI